MKMLSRYRPRPSIENRILALRTHSANASLVNCEPLVGVEDLRPPRAQRLLQRAHAEGRVHRVRQLPRQHVARRPVHHRHQVEKPPGHRHIGDVRAPHLIRPRDLDAPQQIRKHPVLRVRDARLGTPVDRLDPHLPHQPADPVSADRRPLAPKVARHLPIRVKQVVHVELIHATHESEAVLALAFRLVVRRRPAHALQGALLRQRQRAVSLDQPSAFGAGQLRNPPGSPCA